MFATPYRGIKLDYLTVLGSPIADGVVECEVLGLHM